MLINLQTERGYGELIDLCKKCFESNLVGSFFFDTNNPERHLTGYIADYNNDEILIKHISPDGYYDGYILAHISDINRIDLCGKYEKKVERLYLIRNQTHPSLKNTSSSFASSVIEWASKNKLIVSAELESRTISGFVLYYNDDSLHLQVIDEFGELDGETIIYLNNILSFAVDTTTEQSLKLLTQK